jgi:uncharacterized membrane protein YfcA
VTLTLLLLFVAGAAGGALNAVAGGGSFIVFPTMLFAGVAPVAANATCAVALWPASVASAYAYRHDMTAERRLAVALGIASVLGGLGGAFVLLRTPDAAFVRHVPWLLLAATLMFVFGPVVAKRLRASAVAGGALALASIAQFAISIYGGYFGAGMGILTLAVFSLIGMTDLHAMNGLKSLLAVLINGAAVAAFVVHDAVRWAPGLWVLAGGLVGGYAGARLARRGDAKHARTLVCVIAWMLTGYFFIRTYT